MLGVTCSVSLVGALVGITGWCGGLDQRICITRASPTCVLDCSIDTASREMCADMRNMLQEFKDFINKGDVVMIAVGLVMALTFKAIIDAFVEGIINPIIAAIFGETSYVDMGFSINGSFISIGIVIGAIINFVAVAIILFFIVRAYNHWKAEDDDAAPTEVELLTEIRDALRNR